MLSKKYSEDQVSELKRTVLITGYAEGFGEALRARFSDGGYQVIPISRSVSSSWATDLTDPEAVAALFDRLDREPPPLAGIIHNAMQFHRQSFMRTSPQVMHDVWQSMVMTAFNVSQQAIARLQTQSAGALIFTGASGSLNAGAHYSAFSSAKFALRGLTQALAKEVGPHGVHVAHVVIDGLIRSGRSSIRFEPSPDYPMIEPDDLAEQYWQIFHQPSSCWTHEFDIRPMPKYFSGNRPCHIQLPSSELG